jgi:signal transduction histidine kinase
MPRGGTLHVSIATEWLAAERTPNVGSVSSGDYVVLNVTDSGIGIAPEIIRQLFDPFFSTKDAGSGTGLGLSIAQAIVTEAGGAIAVANEPGIGSRFSVYLPRGDAAIQAGLEQPGGTDSEWTA